MLKSLLIVCSFVSIIPVPQKFLPEWTSQNLRFFCVMLALTGIIIFSPLWMGLYILLRECVKFSGHFRGLVMTLATLALTGGLHMDGLMDTSDAIFSHRDRQTRLKILSDTHAGSFAVMACVSALMLKTFLFAEIFESDNINFYELALIPAWSRLGMALLLNNVKFAKSGGLAVMLGTSRSSRDNFIFAAVYVFLAVIDISCGVIILLSLVIWRKVCIKIFGGITGDLLGAFVEASEIILLFVKVLQ
ncbi:MAG: adenosylcobinamide-GDP ribazoletransferase [Synergistaceae bacterium]|nr:adenosylcobinamide-GDP ribazoletransferase [Synergistaceae bacterium]